MAGNAAFGRFGKIKKGLGILKRGSFRTGTKQKVKQNWGTNCVYCGKPADTIDHIVLWKKLTQTFKSRNKN